MSSSIERYWTLNDDTVSNSYTYRLTATHTFRLKLIRYQLQNQQKKKNKFCSKHVCVRHGVPNRPTNPHRQRKKFFFLRSAPTLFCRICLVWQIYGENRMAFMFDTSPSIPSLTHRAIPSHHRCSIDVIITREKIIECQHKYFQIYLCIGKHISCVITE